MRGERVDVNRIKQNVQEGMGDFKDRMQAWGEEVKTAGQRMTQKAQEFSRTQGADLAADFKRTAKTGRQQHRACHRRCIQSIFSFYCRRYCFLSFCGGAGVYVWRHLAAGECVHH